MPEESPIGSNNRPNETTDYLNVQVENTYIGIVPDLDSGDSLQKTRIITHYSENLPRSQKKNITTNALHEEKKCSNGHSLRTVLLQTDI